MYLKDGQRFTGLLIEQTEEKLVLRVSGLDVTFDAATVERVQELPSVMARYKEIRESVGNDPEQVLRLAQWLRARERYDLALEEIRRVLVIDPANTEAKREQVLLNGLIRLRDNAGAGRARRDAERALRQPPPPVPGAARDPIFPVLSQEQINLLKVYELDLANPGRLLVKRETIARLMDQHAGSPLIPVTQEGREALYRRPAVDILDLMFRLQARDLYGEVEVLDHPAALRQFRDTVHRSWLINSCATSACHGGAEAGRLMLLNRRPNAEQTFYTNFLILDRYRMEDGTALINYDAPDRSPLLHLGLPRGDAIFKHPVVRQGVAGRDAWRPAFRSSDDQRFRDAVRWISSMYRPHPEYPIRYDPPGSSEVPPAQDAPEPVRR
ncbi:MAG TPA: hypothetical protein VD963_00435 [Phycisphaerales bacterium]|nr:hypothetical protein [Phycisphaerales bacterium]